MIYTDTFDSPRHH